jgi:predicted CXXCH cytochrome family protein
MRKIPIMLIGFVLVLLSQCQIPKTQITNADFIGSRTCVECHEKEYAEWQGSDHDNAMDTAIASTVLGDFNNAEFERNGFVSRFYTKDGKYFVHTKGLGGLPGDFQISYTFGVRPLQQYLIPFENGRMQCLPIAWDTGKKRWYQLADSVYQDQEIKPDDWLYWTNNGQNWNGMCAECHSTNLRKNYNPETHVFNTRWSEIDVACEACHGPSSEHNKWAANKDKSIANYGLVVQTSNISSETLINQCAYCHSRRSSFGDFIHPRKDLFDIISPQLPVEPYYFPDGQILEEDYVYSSFSQSKMHQNNVRCTNCHNPHSLKLKFKGNKLCFQCHQEEKYDKYEHHFHKTFKQEAKDLILGDSKKTIKAGEGSLCVNCHMPGRFFMGVDYRRDHSMRIPRPDLSDSLHTPNACTQCHSDKSNKWAWEQTIKWYGKTNRFHFGETMFLAARNDTSSLKGLYQILDEKNSSAIIKAAATYYLGGFQSEENYLKNKELLKNEYPLVRREAVKNFIPNNRNDLKKTIIPLLGDSTLMVRNEAVSKLSRLKQSDFDSIEYKMFKLNLADYIKTMEYSADFASSRHNLGNLYANIGETQKAIKNYEEALMIDNLFYPAKMNLAMLYNKIGEKTKAENLLQQVVVDYPTMGEAFYSLGLLQAELKKYDEAIFNLKQASVLIPQRNRIKLNLFKLLNFKNDFPEALKTIDECIKSEPGNPEYLYAKIELLVKNDEIRQAKEIAKKILEIDPENRDKKQLLEFINSP